ncbi:MAG: hypothetical protein K6T78_08065 [Alicyclobacillus sp.]|nr:hypothetical protein [Alicyclobacillus sp.]
MDMPARGITTGTPVPNREREEAVKAPGALVVHKMDPEQIEAYLQKRYGDRLDKPGKKPITPGPRRSQEQPTNDEQLTPVEEPQTPLRETGEPADVAPDKEAKPRRPRKPRPEVTREQYLALRLQGKGRIRALTELFGYVAAGYAALEQWGLRDAQAEESELAKLRGETAVPETAPETVTVQETAAPVEPQPTITVPVPVSSDMVRAVLQALIRDVHATAVAKGWHDDPVPLPVHLALIHSEVSEALQADRKGEGDAAVAEELADVVIRVFDTAAAHRLDLADALLTKMETNKRRPYRHGGRKY